MVLLQRLGRIDLWLHHRCWRSATRTNIRTLLTAQYWCEDDWRKRFEQDETLKHIATERYFFELNQKYQQKQPVSAVDIDIFVNSIRRPESQIELEHILKRFRQTPRTVNTLESTHHAVCRFYLEHHKLPELLAILNERVQYGIFPDIFSYNVLMDRFIQTEDWPAAFDVVKLMMLQEDGGNEISKTLALHILDRMLNNGLVDGESPAATETETAIADEDEDVEYVRVPYLTNPFFDDHFDLVNRQHIFGKCLYFFGRELEKSSQSAEDRTLANTCMIIGLIFYEKWDKLDKLLDRLSLVGKEKIPVTSEPLQIIAKRLEQFTEAEQTEKRDRLAAVQSRMEAVQQRQPETMADLIGKRIEKLPTLEPADRERMQQMMAEFRQTRSDALHQQMERLMEEQRRQELQRRKTEFEEKKRLYYFFENFPKHEIDFVEAEKRIQEIRSKTVVEEDYIPPERY